MEDKNKIILIILFAFLIISIFLDTIFVNLLSYLTIENSVLRLLFSNEAILLLLIGVTIYLYKTEKKLILPLWITTVVSAVLSIIIKLIIARPRFFAEKFYAFGIPNFSFPSSHATIAFAILPIILKHPDKKLRYIWIAYAILVALSRILLKQHYLSDVLGGALIGYLIGTVVISQIKKIL